MQLLVKRDGRFWNTADGRKYLDDGSPDYAAGLGHTASMWHGWSGLTDAVREGRPALRAGHQRTGRRVADAVHRGDALPGGATGSGRGGPGRAGRRQTRPGRRGGSGAFAMAFAAKEPGLVAVVFDLPNVVPLTRRYIAEAGLTGRVTAAVGDYLVDPLPNGVRSRVPVGRRSQQFGRSERRADRLVRVRPQTRRAGSPSSIGSWTTTVSCRPVAPSSRSTCSWPPTRATRSLKARFAAGWRTPVSRRGRRIDTGNGTSIVIGNAPAGG